MTETTRTSTAPQEIAAFLEAHPALVPALEAARAHGAPFEEAVHPPGLELLARNDLGSIPNRARIFLFPAPLSPGGGRERWVAFFYKRSNLPWSRDRFSYGGVVFEPSTLTKERAGAWIGFAASGFDPEMRPADLRPALPFTVPE